MATDRTGNHQPNGQPPDPAAINAPAANAPHPEAGADAGGTRRWHGTSVGRFVARFLETEASSGLVLMAAAAIAMVWANTLWHHGYEGFVGAAGHVHVGDHVVRETVHGVVNDGLMAVFFLVAGLEVKREITSGELSTPRRAALPVLAAVGGMVVPIAIYALCNAGHAGSNGWALPMATDVAFALGVLALLGRRVPPTLKVFLLALAVVDDIGAIAVIAVLYSDRVRWGPLAVAAGCVVLVVVLGRLRLRWLWPYLLIGMVMWAAVRESGVHPTVAGVALAFAVPGRLVGDRLEDRLHPFTAFLVIPLFGLVNAGVHLGGNGGGGAGATRVVVGVVLGLVVGKAVGVSLATWLAVRFRLGHLPDGVGWRHVLGLSALSGIGFTVALLLTGLAFDSAHLETAGKTGILLASVLAGCIGAAVLARSGRDSGREAGRDADRDAGQVAAPG